MSVGLQTLRALCETQARTEWRHLNRDLFLDEEHEAFDQVQTFYRRYGQLPTMDALAELGLRLTPAPGPLGHYTERLRSRAAYNGIMEHHRPFLDATGRQDIPAALQALDAMRRAAGAIHLQQDVTSLGDAAELVLEQYQYARAHPGETGITLGWPFLDAVTGGAQPGDLVTIVARPGMGKTYLLLWSAYRAWLSGASVLLVSMEMQIVQMARRMIGIRSGINPDMIRRGQVSMFAEPRLHETITDFRTGAPFHVVAGAFSKSVTDLDNLIQELAPDVAYADAGYLLRPTEGGLFRGKRFEILAETGEDMKRVAMARNRPIVQTVQFNRGAEERKGGGGLANIGGTDVVGQVSSIVIGVKHGEGDRERTSRRLDLMKNREGEDDRTHFVNFLFEPVDFSHAPDLDVIWQAQRQRQASGADSPGIAGMGRAQVNLRDADI